jgi:transmembrane sensor
MTASEQLVNAAIAEQARGWLVAHDAGPLGAQETAAFLTWLRASPVHVGAFLRVSRIARDLKAAAEAPDFALEALLEEARTDTGNHVLALGSLNVQGSRAIARRSGTRSVWALAAMLAGLIVGLSLLWWSRDGERFGLPRTYETGHGEQAAWRLPDGSTLHLNTGGSATVRYTSAERVVDLNRGQVLFEVARGDGRRFRVSAGEAQVLAVGTEFDVYRRRDVTLVTVVEGTVTVYGGEPPPLSSGIAPSGASLRVNAGQQLGVEAGKLWSEPVPVDAKAAVAWLQHQIVAEDRPLGEIVDEFNRYARVSIEIDDPALRMLRVSGRFDVYDTESFVAFLSSLEGVAVERTAIRIRVINVGATKGERPPSTH